MARICNVPRQVSTLESRIFYSWARSRSASAFMRA